MMHGHTNIKVYDIFVRLAMSLVGWDLVPTGKCYQRFEDAQRLHDQCQ